MLVETQALVSTAVYGTPQRSGTGFDLRRLNMLLAVLEKRCEFKLGQFDVFLNLAGGLKIQDPANDLAVVAAILSSKLNVPLDNRTCFAVKVGLSGGNSPVPRLEQRMMEAARLGDGTHVGVGPRITPQGAQGIDCGACETCFGGAPRDLLNHLSQDHHIFASRRVAFKWTARSSTVPRSVSSCSLEISRHKATGRLPAPRS